MIIDFFFSFFLQKNCDFLVWSDLVFDTMFLLFFLSYSIIRSSLGHCSFSFYCSINHEERKKKERKRVVAQFSDDEINEFSVLRGISSGLKLS